MLRYSFVGDAAAWVHAIERLATRWGCAAAVNGVAKGDTETAFRFRLHAAAVMAKPSHAGQRPQLVWELVGPRIEQATDEWLYQLEKQEGSDEWAHLNKAREAFFKGDFDAALARVATGRGALAAVPSSSPPAGGAAASELHRAYASLAAAAARRPRRPHALLHDAHLSAEEGAAAAAAGAGPDAPGATGGCDWNPLPEVPLDVPTTSAEDL